MSDSNSTERSMSLCECGCGQSTEIHKRTNAQLGYIRGEYRKLIIGHRKKKVLSEEDRKKISDRIKAYHANKPKPTNLRAAQLCECGCGQPTTIIKLTSKKRGVRAGDYNRFVIGHQGRGKSQSEEANAKRSKSLRLANASKVYEVTCGHPECRNYGNGMCRSCWMAKWHKDNPEKQIGSASWAKRNPEAMKKLSRKNSLKKYGLTLEDFEKMWESQGGKCANSECDFVGQKDAMNTRVYGLNVDHSHETSAIRGLLCARCNTALGHVNDSIPKLTGLIVYLKKHAAN